MKVKTIALSDAALDWAVAKCEGLTDPEHNSSYTEGRGFCIHGGTVYSPSTDWAYGGPIIAREHIALRPTLTEGGYRSSMSYDAVEAKIELPGGSVEWNPKNVVCEYGPTALIAGMRCYVASKMGDEVEIPEALA